MTALSVLLPLLLALALGVPAARRLALAAAPWAALPALVMAITGPEAGVSWSWALLGIGLEVADETSAIFLLFTACLWFAAGLFSRTHSEGDPHRARFWGFFLLTLSGNLGLVLAQDLVSFNLFYSVMTFASWGLVVHEASATARRAGRVYLVMALVAEMVLLTAFVLIVGARVNLALAEVPAVVAGSAQRELIVALVLLGFGVKAGALGLHMWLPLAHPVAPTPASAVLSGALIKAGLLGWLRFLPLGLVALPGFGLFCLFAGIAAALLGVALGLTQRAPKTILAYSSVSQMGLMTAVLGLGLWSPQAAPAAVSAILFYALHHALAKGALFLGTGVVKETGGGLPGRLVALGLMLPALDLSGAPLSSGAVAKLGLKEVVGQAPWGAASLSWFLSLAAVSSSLLMGHFLFRALVREVPVGGRGQPRVGLWGPWGLLLVFDGVVLLSPLVSVELAPLLHLGGLWSATWPVVAGALAAVALWRARPANSPPELPAGDVLVWVERPLTRLWRALFPREEQPKGPGWRVVLTFLARPAHRLLRGADRAELALGTFGSIGLCFVGLLVLALAVRLLGA